MKKTFISAILLLSGAVQANTDEMRDQTRAMVPDVASCYELGQYATSMMLARQRSLAKVRAEEIAAKVEEEHINSTQAIAVTRLAYEYGLVSQEKVHNFSKAFGDVIELLCLGTKI